jgi:hypothetical protein
MPEALFSWQTTTPPAAALSEGRKPLSYLGFVFFLVFSLSTVFHGSAGSDQG